MTTLIHSRIFAALTASCVAAVACTQPAPADTSAPDTVAREPSPSGDASAPSANGTIAPPDAQPRAQTLPTHCDASEGTLFSCTLEGSKRTISLCMKSAGETRYVSGPLGRPDLVHRDRDGESPAFQRTSLTYAGGTGGYAYSFHHAGQTRVIYSISGQQELERQGELSTDAEFATAIVDQPCTTGTVSETQDLALLREARRWPEQSRLAQHGLPAVSP